MSLILSLCPKCRTEHELSDKLLGQKVVCQGCNQQFEVSATQRKPEEDTFNMQSFFGAPPTEAELPDSEPKRKRQGKMRLTPEGKHILSVPPPPLERWAGRKNDKDDEDSQPFRDFRHNSRVLKEFRAREEGSDYSGLLIVGMFLTTLIVFGFLGWLTYLIVRGFLG